MPNQKDYPNWFYHFREPYSPWEPCEFFDHAEILHTIYDNEFAIKDIPEGTDVIEVDNDDGTQIYFKKITKVCNTDYHEQKIKYDKEMVIYRQKLEEWQTWKARWDYEVQQEQKAERKKAYDVLKEEFGEDEA